MDPLKKMRYQKKRSTPISTAEFVDGIRNGERAILAKAITLIESNHPDHFYEAQKILSKVLPFSGTSIRLGITGVPGAGKSTFIEKLGTELCKSGKKVAVLAVDPTSVISKGSILGDKTRMENLSKEPNAFIRPSPTEGELGGVHRKTRETISLCEAAGYEIIIIETVGVGQSEVAVRSMVDMFIMLSITGSGDELQGMKKGMMELCDLIVITKADGDNREKAIATKNEFNRILRFLAPATQGWKTRAFISSAITGEGISEIWQEVEKFLVHIQNTGILKDRRKLQTKNWLTDSVWDQLKRTFLQNPIIQNHLRYYEEQVIQGKVPVSLATEELLKLYFHEAMRKNE